MTGVRKGDKVLISCITSCGKCDFCKKGMYSHCRHGGWILGNTIDGTQAEHVRIPYADTSLYPVPADADEGAMVMLSDILPTGFECGVLNGQVKPGDTVAIVGAGPVGLAALLTAQFYSPAEIIMIDIDPNRLAGREKLGATAPSIAGTARRSRRSWSSPGAGRRRGDRGGGRARHLRHLPGHRGRRAATSPTSGVHGKSVTLHLERLWSHNITLTTRLVDTVTTPMLLKMVESGRLQPKKLMTHGFGLADVMKAYDTFGNAAKEKRLEGDPPKRLAAGWARRTKHACPLAGAARREHYRTDGSQTAPVTC